MKKNYLTLIILLFSTLFSFSQVIGDFQSSSTGNWSFASSWEIWNGSSWDPATTYPGQSSGSYTITVQSGNTITVNTNLTTQTIGDVIVNGTLTLDPVSNPWEVRLNTSSIDINGASAILDFSSAQASLYLPSGSSVSFQNGGDISGSCTPNNEIFIGTNQYAACKNPSTGSYTFGEVVAAGGTINAEISIPATSPNSVEVCSLINFSGGYSGTGINVTADWVLRFPDGTLSTLIDDFPLSSSAITTSSSFTPTIIGEYVLTLEVTDGIVTNADNVVFNITADVTAPVFATPPSNVTVECVAGVPAMTDLGWTDNCDGVGTVIGSDSPFSGCEGIITRTWTYTDIAGNPASASQFITIDYSGGLTAPANTTSTVSCEAAATDPGNPGSITDACGRTVNAVLVGSTETPDPVTCEGTIVWTYRYTDCDTSTTVDWTHTYTIDYSGGLTAPANTTSTVSCEAAATDPGNPGSITDACGRTVNAVLVGSTETPDPVTCEGTIVWTYRYTDCDTSTTVDWTHTYTIDYSGGLTAPANTTSTVSCEAAATDPGNPGSITDACGRTVNAVLVGSTETPDPVTCEGTIVWTYRYTDCDTSTTVDWTHTYTIDYSGGLTAPANTTSTVSCEAAATDPGNPGSITDACGRTVNAVLVGSTETPDPVTCEGTIVWTYRYTDCDTSTTVDWTHTYTIDYSGGLTAPANTTSTVSCEAAATDPGNPGSITDACGRTVNAVLVGSTETPDPVTCEGTIVWTYRYTDCDTSTTVDWTHTYTIDYSGGLTAPANTTSTVSCEAAATDPGNPGSITDACGRTVNAVLVGSTETPDPVTCEGTIVWTYRYTDCDTSTTVDWTHTYTIDYSGGLTAPANTTSTVSCEAAATDPGNPGSITDACGRTVNAVLVGSTETPNPVTCEGNIVWTYRYTDCDTSTTVDWTHTYTIDYSGGLTAPANTTSTVSCEAAATDPGNPGSITDACGRTVNAVLVGSTETPDPVTCEGTIVWTYRYTDCDTSTTVDWTHTYTIDYSGGLTAPANTTSTVSCEAAATDPGAPADITDACGRTVSALLVGSTETPDPVTCEGTIVWTYRYTDCDTSTTVDWTHTYTIDYSGGLTAPANTTSTVSCEAAATDPGNPGSITDACGRTVNAVLVGSTETPNPVTCEGNIVWTYRYTDCDGTTTDDWTHTYTIDYSGGLTAPANTTSTVSCEAAATDPGAPADITDACGRTVSALLVGSTETPNPVTCEGNIVWTYRYTDCDGTTTDDWTHTYTIDYSGGLTAPANTTSTVSCEAAATDPGAPADITDACGRTVSALLVGSTETPNPVTCEGNIVWTYRYTDCDGTTTDDWTHTYTIDYTDPVVPSNGTSTVQCLADAVQVAAPVVTDACGNNLTAVITENADPVPACGANKIYTYTYTDCANNVSVYTFTYTINDTTNPTVTAPTATPLECSSDLPAAAATIGGFNGLNGANASDNCTATANLSISSTTGGLSGQSYAGTITRTYTITDVCGNDTTVNHVFNINDTTPPTAVCTNYTVQLANGMANISAININNGSSDNCGIASMSVLPNSFDCSNVGANTVTLTVTDNNGNTSSCNATVTIQDVTPPTVICQNIEVTIPFGATSVSITPADIDNGSTDACGIDSYSLSQDTFTCGNIYGNTVTLTVTDIWGNSNSCTANVIVNAPTLSTGSLIGEVVNPSPVPYVVPSNLIEVTSCPGGVAVAKDVALTFTGAVATDVDGWQVSIDEGVTWSPLLSGTQDQVTHTLTGLLSTTLVRAVINTGGCAQFSPVATIRFLPPDLPPIIVDSTSPFICLGDNVEITAESYYETYGQFGDSGLFNHAQPEDWRVDGLDGNFPADGDNTGEPTWAETAQTKLFSGIRYSPQEGSKFALVHGGSAESTMETPVINTIGMDPADAYMEFYTAYFFCSGAEGRIELSFDAGETYPILLDTYTGENPSDIIMDHKSGQPCATNNNGNHPTTTYDPITIDLSPYIGYSSLRIRFYYDSENTGSCSHTFPDTNSCGNNTRTVESSWAVDGVRLPYGAIDEEIVWEDEFGNEVTRGSTVNIIPVTPGVQVYGSVVEVNQCRQLGDDGTQFVTIEASLAYAGEDFTPTTAKCGQSSITLNAYDNTRSAYQNSLDIDEFGNASYPRPGSGNVVPTQLYTGNDPNIPNTFPDYPGTNMTGTWSVTPDVSSCGVVPVFSSDTDPGATFTAGPGTYTLTWTLANGCSDSKVVTISSCDEINFDGVDDYITFKNNYNLNGPFSIEAWIKPNSVTGEQILFSRKDNGDNTKGYDFRLSGRSVEFNWYSGSGNGTIAKANVITGNAPYRWYHLAVTFDGSSYKLYADGVDLLGTVTGTVTAPEATPNNIEAILGAMDQSPPGLPVNYYTGWMDEFRVWNRVLNVQHIRQMMNQEILDLGGNVGGEVIPTKIYGVDTNQDGTEEDLLTWAHLDGYYRMAVDCGYLTAYKGVSGRLRNITTPQTESAPIPFTTQQNGDWDNNNTWSQPSVWYIPNSTQHGTQIDWNIVRTSHNITSDTRDITLLGLLVDANELTITGAGTQDETNSGHGLWVTDYLKLDGMIDLVGESQLVQKRYDISGNPTIQFNESILDVASSGYLERDQQGTTNLFNYNYWSPPVSTVNTTANNTPYIIDGGLGGVLRGGSNSGSPTDITWVTGGYNASGTPDPIGNSNRWIYAYENYIQNFYAAWSYKGSTATIATGLGFTLKGSGVGNPVTDVQNYVFTGKPNNATITNPVSVGNVAMVGNPYPSAIDAKEFIRDNIPGGNSGTSGSIDGTLYFWEHYTSNFTHILLDYEGGYALYNIIGGNPAASLPLFTDDGYQISGSGISSLTPEQYIPVGQGFFVNASNAHVGRTNDVSFHNDQRFFQREVTTGGANNGSAFLRSSNPNSTPNNQEEDVIKRIRLTGITPELATRPLLLGFVPNNLATDGFDYGYDGKNSDEFAPSDMSWIIDDENYLIQGVGDFDKYKQYPLGITIATSGEIEISLTALENFTGNVNVYVYDALLGTYTKINNSSYKISLDAAEYLDRFYITFTKAQNNLLDIIDNELEQAIVNYLNSSNEIYINVPDAIDVKQVYLVNLIGQTVKSWNITNMPNISGNEFKIPVKNIADGAYIIKVESNTSTINKKIIIKQ